MAEVLGMLHLQKEGFQVLLHPHTERSLTSNLVNRLSDYLKGDGGVHWDMQAQSKDEIFRVWTGLELILPPDWLPPGNSFLAPKLCSNISILK